MCAFVEVYALSSVAHSLIHMVYMCIGVKYLNAKAHMKDANTIAFRDSRGKEGEISADKVILAVGGRPYVTENTPGHELCMTSDDIFWDKRPEGPGTSYTRACICV